MNQEYAPLWSDDAICEELGATSDAHIDYASSFAIGLDIALKVIKTIRDDYEALRQPAPQPMDANGLLSCPHCGGKADTVEIGDNSPCWLVYCIACDRAGPFSSEAKAIAHWNRRAAQPMDAPGVPLTDEVREAAMRASAWLVDMLNDHRGDGMDDLRADVIVWRAWLAAQPPAP